MADPLQEEEAMATEGHRTRVQARVEAPTMQPRQNLKTMSIELGQQIKQAIM